MNAKETTNVVPMPSPNRTSHPAPANGDPLARSKYYPAFPEAQRSYAEQFGDVKVSNTYLKIALAAVSLVAAGSLTLGYQAIKKVASFQPLVITIDKVGKAEAIRYDNFKYTPAAAEINYFLAQFCRLYYSRNKDLLRQNFTNALLFMEADLAQRTRKAWDATKVIDSYLENQPADIDVQVLRVTIPDLREPPYKATVDFEQVYYNPLNRIEKKRVFYTANFVFVFDDATKITSDTLLVNPLGLRVTYFREDIANPNSEPTSELQ